MCVRGVQGSQFFVIYWGCSRSRTSIESWSRGGVIYFVRRMGEGGKRVVRNLLPVII